MPDWPQSPIMQSPGFISTQSALLGLTATLPASAAWPLANKAFFAPFRVTSGCVAYKMAFGGGVTATGNVDMGIYDPQGNKLVSSGAIAKPSSAEAVADITDTYLPPGLYYMAMSHDGTANIIVVTPAALALAKLAGVMEMASAYTLPDPVTYAALGTAIIPAIAIYTRPH